MKKYFHKRNWAFFFAIILVISILPVANADHVYAIDEDTTTIFESAETSGSESEVTVDEVPETETEVSDDEILPGHNLDEQGTAEAAIVDDLQPETTENVRETRNFGLGRFVYPPPEGTNIKAEFPNFIGDTKIDSFYTNVAIATMDATSQFGAMWAKDKLDLTKPFSTIMYLHLGHSAIPANRNKVADGMTFTMHNYSPATSRMIGGRGEGLGVWTGRTGEGKEDGSYLPRALVIEFDTYINTDIHAYVWDPESKDPVKYAHCALIYPKPSTNVDPISVTDHKNIYFFEPTQQWIPFTVKWKPEFRGVILGGTLTYSFDGVEQVEKIANVVSLFGGTQVWWGFTGATGAQTAVQAAAISKLPLQQHSLDVLKSVKNADAEDLDGKYAYAGDTLTYTIKVTGSMADDGSRIGPINITDKLSEYVEYVGGDVTISMSDGSKPFTVSPTLDKETLTVNTGRYLEKSSDWLEITFAVKVKENTSVGTIVENIAEAQAEKVEDSAQSNTTKVTIADYSRKSVSSASAAGIAGATVTAEDKITYEIFYFNGNKSQTDLTITDALHTGVEYQGHTGTQSHTGDGGNYDKATHTLTWKISGVAAGESGSVTVTVRVKPEIELADIDNKLVNQAVLNWGASSETVKAENPVAGYKVIYDGNGGVTAQSETAYTEGLFSMKSDYTVRGNEKVNFVKNGYTFLGWNTASDGSGDAYNQGDVFYTVTSDIMLYAQWGKNLVFRKIDANSVGNESITPLTDTRFALYMCSHLHDANCGGQIEPSVCSHTHTPLEEGSSCWILKSDQPSYGSVDDSIVTFSSISSGSYLIMETKAPNGYMLPKGQWIIEVKDGVLAFVGTSGDPNIPAIVTKTNFDGKESDSNVEFWIGNIKQYELPVAGHDGRFWYTALGCLLLIAGIFMGIRYTWYRTENRHNIL